MDQIDQGQQAAMRLAQNKGLNLLSEIRHPLYNTWFADWEKFRYTYKGGRAFVDKYLKKFSNRETDEEFKSRKDVSYCPAHAKAAINEIKNSISERLVDVLRQGGPASYNEAICGSDGGVDYSGSSMDKFLADRVIPDLLVIGKVGVFVDKEPLAPNATMLDASAIRPYVYTYQAEDILTWTYNQRNELTKVLLVDNVETTDAITGLITGVKRQTRYLSLEDDGVHVQICDEEGNKTDKVLNLKRIPFFIAELSDSLLTDVADYQVALLNLASSDVNYGLRSNFPFYVEQYSPQSDLANRIAKSIDTTGDSAGGLGTESAGPTVVATGTSAGRRYPLGTEAPSFIHPSSEPLKASMDKQEQLKTEIRQLVSLALTNIRPQRASADSKEKDNQGLESGLSYIGMELEHLERQIAEIWAEYEDATEAATILYPDKYSSRTDEDRRAEAKELLEQLPKVPSLTYQKELAKRVSFLLLYNKVDDDMLDVIYKEIDDAEVINIDPDVIAKDIENQLVSNDTASRARLYPAGETEKAAKDHAERATRIAAAQSAGKIDAAARGVKDLAPDQSSAKQEKATSQAAAMQDSGGKAVRG
jgi:hypothetical protein